MAGAVMVAVVTGVVSPVVVGWVAVERVAVAMVVAATAVEQQVAAAVVEREMVEAGPAVAEAGGHPAAGMGAARRAECLEAQGGAVKNRPKRRSLQEQLAQAWGTT